MVRRVVFEKEGSDIFFFVVTCGRALMKAREPGVKYYYYYCASVHRRTYNSQTVDKHMFFVGSSSCSFSFVLLISSSSLCTMHTICVCVCVVYNICDASVGDGPALARSQNIVKLGVPNSFHCLPHMFFEIS